MAIRFDITLYEKIKEAYIVYLRTGQADIRDLQKFANYKSYLENDEQVKSVKIEVSVCSKGKNDIRFVESNYVENRKEESQSNRKVLAPHIIHNQDEIKNIKKKEQQRIKQKTEIAQKLKEIQQRLSLKKSKKSKTITQEIIDDSLQYISSIPTEHQDALKNEIYNLKEIIKQKQALLNVREHIIQLLKLEHEPNDDLFNEQFNKLKQLVELGFFSDEERKILKSQLEHTIGQRSNNIYAIDFIRISKRVNSWLDQIENGDESTHSKLLKLNDVDKEIRSSGFEKPEILTLQRSVSQTRKRLTELEQGNKQSGREISVSWNDIDFGINIIRFFSKGKILYTKSLSCKKSFNQIKDSLSSELPQIVLVKDKGKYALKNPKVLKDALDIINQKESGNIVTNTQVIQQEIIVLWDDVNFGNNILYIFSDGKLVYSKSTSCRKSFNQVKEYLSNKLPQIVLVKNQSDVWILKEPIVLQDALNMIRRKESENLLLEEQYRTSQRSYSSIEKYLEDKTNQELVLKRLKDKKQDFLNYLIKYQLSDYKLVPAIEMLSHESTSIVDEEDVFVFSIQHKSYSYEINDYVNIIYENVNPARATIVCTVEKRYYTLALQSIYNFMNNAKEKNKRSRLRHILKLNNYVKNLHLVNHTDMHNWATAISR